MDWVTLEGEVNCQDKDSSPEIHHTHMHSHMYHTSRDKLKKQGRLNTLNRIWYLYVKIRVFK